MRLLSLQINNFRGFGPNSTPIQLDGDLLLFFGPNGYGKTSIAEAIEWLFYGTTKRRQRGDTYSRSEYANSFANVHGGRPVQVEATVLLNGATMRLARRITGGETTETLIDGAVAEFSAINVVPIEAVYPVIAQHGLQTFIHAKPKDRRDAICAALGLDELTSLKAALDSARTSFQRTPPRSVQEARRELSSNAEALGQLRATASLAARWRAPQPQIDLASDLTSLLLASEELTGVPAASVDAALDQLRAHRTEVSRTVFDAERLLLPANWTALKIEAAADIDQAVLTLSSLERAITDALASAASAYSTALLDFWKTGLTLAPSGDQCPMCEADTLSTAQRTELQRRIAAASENLTRRKALSSARDAALQAVRKAAASVERIKIGELSERDRSQLTTMFANEPEALDAFSTCFDQFRAAAEEFRAKTGSYVAFAERVLERIVDVQHSDALRAEAVQIRDAVFPDFNRFAAKLQNYADEWNVFKPKLDARIASNETIARIDAVGKTLRSVGHMRVLDRFDQIARETQELIRQVESCMQTTQSQLLTTRGSEVKDLYDRLNRGANVGFEIMEPGTDTMKLHAKSFGVRMPAAANLSECQLNCVGLAMWLMRATTPSSPFGFVLLDDPVQSMDDDHAEAFISDIVPHLLNDHGKQVIVLSHVRRIVERLRELNANRTARLYHLDAFDQVGPTVTEQIKLKMLLSEIRGAARGNEANREYAVDRIRVLAEQFIREVHLRIVGTPAPAQFDRATASQLLPLFQTIAGTTTQEHVGLRDTVGFCDPAHHTQVGYSVPLTTNIQPHIDRLDSLIRKYFP